MLLYVHIPFCDSKCHYCSFNSYVDKFALRRDYMAALGRQLEEEIERLGLPPESLETLFIGGGTPSTVAPELYAPLFARLQPYLKPGAEITSEANPNSATPEWLAGMHALGVNRISFGVQSFDPEKLKRLGRAHTPDQAVRAVTAARDAGFEHLSLDLIYGVAGDTKPLLAHDLEQAFALPVDHLSAYALTIEEGTPFSATPEVADEKLALTSWLFERIKAHGFEQYEISNFGRYRSRHNLGYWEYKPYIGLGAGAVGCIDTVRYYPHRDVEAYITDPLFRMSEPLDAEAVKTERLFLGLRSVVGVPEALLDPEELQRARWLEEEGKLRFEDGRFYNTDYLLSDEIVLYLQG
ncbi:radical SAM family heme chaperone HemW [Sulfurimonas sp. HSL-3221]|uniref:radical SAM family heme chaperone HemW n=1 Tax=Thiomicrolovo sulfuroxydans TaxID=2894755 RepID=UPI001E3F819A|nr:radical SAM family heme chaperone HemW [Sulfurimonas sp. HSL-3221]UFS61701.1 radical SAM family heme chaperone HemW [Sulfurimonas sp. HSL-3221]